MCAQQRILPQRSPRLFNKQHHDVGGKLDAAVHDRAL